MAGTARAHFREELHGLEVQALGALDLVVTALDRVMEALRHQDIELAAIVVNDDDRLDGRYLEVHQGILSLLALQAPVAGHEPPLEPELLARVLKMGELARSETSQAKQAFALRDAAVAEDLVRQDAEINKLNREVFRAAVDMGTDSDRREWAMTMTLVARALERIGDNAVDIGEQTAFIVTGLFREFSDSSHPSLS